MLDDLQQQPDQIADLLRRSAMLRFPGAPIVPAQPDSAAATPPANGAVMATPSSGNQRPAMVAPSILSPAQQDATSARTKLDTDQQNGSSIQRLQQKHPFWGGLVRGLDVTGSILAPGAMARIPGTTINHNVQLNQDQARLKNTQTDVGDEEKNKLTEAQTADVNAQAQERTSPQQPKSAFGLWLAQNPNGKVGDWLKTEQGSKPEAKDDVHAMYAGAVADALQRGVDPAADPKVKQLRDSITALEKPTTPKEANRDDRAIEILSKAPEQRTPEENSYLRGYQQYTNMTKVQPGVSRMEVLSQAREYPVINKKTGELEYRNAQDINGNRGLYAPAAEGSKSMGKEAVFQDLHYNIDTARKALQALPTLDTGTRAALSYALRSTDPRSAISTFLTGTVGQHLSPEQQEAVQSIALLQENAMSLRSVAGMGQGSDELRSAILATIPSGKSASKDYALKQLDKFEAVVSRLEGGVPRVTSQQPKGGGNQGQTIGYTDGGKTYQIPADQEKDFLADHPKAKKR